MNFVLLGAAGYIAPRHLKAIKDVGGNLLAVLDPHDSVGVLDSYFPDTLYFKEFEIFDRYINKMKADGTNIDYVSICTPNYLHESHIMFGLRIGADVICEKPLVIKSKNLSRLIKETEKYQSNIYTILQLRLHEAIIDLKNTVQSSSTEEKFEVGIQYFTPRGPWYKYSWKGDEHASGGIAMNIGIHLFDMLLWVFGEYHKLRITCSKQDYISGILRLKKANINWELSTNKRYSPHKDSKPFRKITINGEELEFSKGFTELHTQSYKEIIAGRGFSAQDAFASIDLVNKINNIK